MKILFHTAVVLAKPVYLDRQNTGHSNGAQGYYDSDCGILHSVQKYDLPGGGSLKKS
jgi:hypothetical protein